MQQNNGLDKSQIISFAVLCLVLFGFMFYFQRNQETEDKQIAEKQKTEQAKKPVTPTAATNINPNVTPGAIQTAELANSEMKIQFSSLGGQDNALAESMIGLYKTPLIQPGDMAELVVEVFDDSRGTYGCRRVAGELNRSGHPVSVGLVADLMRELGLAACQPRARSWLSPSTTMVG